MNPLVSKITEAHGGLARWKEFSLLKARLVQGGALWTLKGQPTTLSETSVTVDLVREWASHSPFGPEAKISSFEPGRVALRDAQGNALEELRSPRSSFAGHTLETPWNELQLAYFAGIAMWTYLNMPFLLAHEGVVIDELPDWSEKGETWHRLRITFPTDIATHSTVQTIYFGDDGLLKRHDYDVEIAGNTPGAHYIDGYIQVQGIKIPTSRRIFPRQPDGQSMAEPLVVSIDLYDIELS
ncbi:hypothetical protein E2F50_19535 [Rhizobium deserti]|uniref:Uncharacterized protein n=1 Tax=Rhizobium deserti TaxID=2547961 RepID=A0A4R5UAY3_9HYPH|nr:hypothetical protein [Rhizobium deserti]TDK31854.1 hypothetical protein E2F50_19535 [Rhizobium deserti]